MVINRDGIDCFKRNKASIDLFHRVVNLQALVRVQRCQHWCVSIRSKCEANGKLSVAQAPACGQRRARILEVWSCRSAHCGQLPRFPGLISLQSLIITQAVSRWWPHFSTLAETDRGWWLGRLDTRADAHRRDGRGMFLHRRDPSQPKATSSI